MSSINFKLLLSFWTHACSVGVVGDIGACGVTGATLVFTLGSSTVGISTLEKNSLCSLNVFGFTEPCLKDTLLKGTSIRECEGPGFVDFLKSVHSIKVQGCILLRLTTREESNTAHSGDNGAG